MSAWIVSRKHIDFMVTAWLHHVQPKAAEPTEQAFLDLLRDNPRDTAAMLVYADWLEEHGELQRAHKLREGTTPADEIGRMFWAECLKSVAYRYPGDSGEVGTRPGPNDFQDSDVKTYQYSKTPLLNRQLLRMLFACYGYQSCEHPGWPKSKSHAIYAQFRGDKDEDLPPGLPWGFDEDTEILPAWIDEKVAAA